MTPQAPDTAIVIATHRREALLRRTLESVAAAQRTQALKEILVVENGGAHGAREVVEAFADRLPARHVLQEAGNKCRALNLALERTTADFVYFLDDDVRVDEAAVEAYVDAAARYGPGHHFSGPLVAEWEAEPPDWLKRYLPPSAVGWDKGDEEMYFDRPYFIGSNWAAFRQDMLAVGGFAEHIGPGSPTGAIGDERDMQVRLLDAGGRGVYLPAARVWHHVPTSACSFEWARHRRYITGFTCGLMGWEPDGTAVPDDLSGRLQLAVLAAKVAVARTLGWSEERRAYLEMTHAEARGYLKGRRVAARRRDEPDPARDPESGFGREPVMDGEPALDREPPP